MVQLAEANPEVMEEYQSDPFHSEEEQLQSKSRKCSKSLAIWDSIVNKAQDRAITPDLSD